MRLVLALAAAAVLSGCAGFDGRGLVAGKSTAEEVEALMGPAAERLDGASGESVRFYSRQPYGRVNYAARIGADGRLVALEQRLDEANFPKLVPGTSRAADVRALFGPPYRVDSFLRLQREVWTYKMLSGTFPKDLYVQMSPDGVMREMMMIDDPAHVVGETND